WSRIALALVRATAGCPAGLVGASHARDGSAPPGFRGHGPLLRDRQRPGEGAERGQKTWSRIALALVRATAGGPTGLVAASHARDGSAAPGFAGMARSYGIDSALEKAQNAG